MTGASGGPRKQPQAKIRHVTPLNYSFSQLINRRATCRSAIFVTRNGNKVAAIHKKVDREKSMARETPSILTAGDCTNNPSLSKFFFLSLLCDMSFCLPFY